jgi:hypothetical protein
MEMVDLAHLPNAPHSLNIAIHHLLPIITILTLMENSMATIKGM